MRIKVKKKSKLIIALPIRILCKARDIYMKTMFICAGSGCRGDAMGYAYTAPQGSNSTGFKGMTEEDLRELVLMSIRMGQGEVESKEMWQKLGKEGGGAVAVAAVRSYSVGVGKIGRIDEEKPCDFVEVDDKIKQSMYSRSRSCAVRNRKVSMLLER